MLTKDTIRLTRRKGQIYPRFLKAEDEDFLFIADTLVELMKHGLGRTYQEVVSDMNEFLSGLGVDPKLSKGLLKVLDDLTEYDSPLENISEERNKVLEESFHLYKSGEFISSTLLGFDVAEKLGKPIEFIRDFLYADLPIFRTITHFPQISGLQFLNRYNLSLVQGILLNAQKIEIEISNPHAMDLRMLFRYLRFFGVYAHIEKKDYLWNLTLSGPLDIAFQTRKYAVKIASFFPAVVRLPSWSLVAQVSLQEDDEGLLKLDASKGLVSHYTGFSNAVSDELRGFFESFRKDASLWELRVCEDFLQTQDPTPCFPDFEIQKEGKTFLFIEVFNAWSKQGFLKRVLQCQKKVFPFPLVLFYPKNYDLEPEEQDLFYATFSYNTIPLKRPLLQLLEKWFPPS